MTPTEPSPRTLHYADDVTAADVEAIEAFLAPRLAEQRDGHYGTASYKMAVALDNLVRDAAHSARWQLQRLAKDDFRDSMDRLICRHDLQQAWNRLWQAVFPWETEQGYDIARWNHLGYLDPRDRAQQEEMTAQVEAELEAEDAARAGQAISSADHITPGAVQ